MKIRYCKDYDTMSAVAAEIFAGQIEWKPDSVLGLATGSTPVGLYNKLAERCKNGLSFDSVRTVNLDEYVGLSPENDQSYRYFMRKNLFDHVNIKPENTHLPNGLAADIEEECRRYDRLIESLGIDIQLLGIGHNGHVGFNEPASSFCLPTNRVRLTESTIQANARFFENGAGEVPKEALTMGNMGIFKAKKVLLLAGKDKTDIVEKAFNGPVTPEVPASILQMHPDCVVLLVK